MSNIINFSDYKQRKLEEKTEKELCVEDEMMNRWFDQTFSNLPDDINFTTLTTTTFTISIDGEIVFTSEDLEDE